VIALLLAAVLAAPSAPPDVLPLLGGGSAALTAASVLARYAEALVVYRTPSVLTFEYLVEQTGARNIEQRHRVFRSGQSQRDELLAVDGKKLQPPSVHIFLGRRNRYTVESLAPRPGAYSFRYIGPVRHGHHTDAVFATTPIVPGAPAAVRQVQIDGSTYLPVSISFTTAVRKGSGTITFGRVQRYWLPLTASAKATYAKLGAEEKITFSHYRFPANLAKSTFAKPRPLPSFHPAPY
jgi:hypothetical protein